MYLCVYTRVRMYACLCVHMYMCVCMCIHVFVCVVYYHLMIPTEWSGVSGLQENLRKTQRELERVQSAEAHAKTGKKRMEAQLKESYR